MQLFKWLMHVQVKSISISLLKCKFKWTCQPATFLFHLSACVQFAVTGLNSGPLKTIVNKKTLRFYFIPKYQLLLLWACPHTVRTTWIAPFLNCCQQLHYFPYVKNPLLLVRMLLFYCCSHYEPISKGCCVLLMEVPQDVDWLKVFFLCKLQNPSQFSQWKQYLKWPSHLNCTTFSLWVVPEFKDKNLKSTKNTMEERGRNTASTNWKEKKKKDFGIRAVSE